MSKDLNTRFRLRDKEISNNNKRIEELEKELKEEIKSRSNWTKAHTKHSSAIFELKNETTNLATYCVNNNETNNNFEKQLNELKEKQEYDDEQIRDELARQVEILTELKEYYNIEKNVANETDFDWKVGIIDRIINSEEVLRDHFKAHKDLSEYQKIDIEILGFWQNSLDGLLAKLDDTIKKE